MEIDASSASSDSNLSQYNPNNNNTFYNNGMYCTFKKSDYGQFVSSAKYYSPSEKKIETLFPKDNKKDGQNKKLVNYENGGFYTSLNKGKDGFENMDGKKMDEINGFYDEGRKVEWNNKKNEGSIHLNTVEPFPKKTLSFSPEQVNFLIIIYDTSGLSVSLFNECGKFTYECVASIMITIRSCIMIVSPRVG